MKYDTDACLVMSRSFITEWAIENKVSKKHFAALNELNNNIAKFIVKKYKDKFTIEKKITAGATVMFDRLTKITDGKDIDVSNLALGIGFIHLLVEQDYFVGSQKSYFKRLGIDIYDFCERHFDRTPVRNATILIDRLDKDMRGESIKTMRLDNNGNIINN